jgi:(p)ppGpp synthase/HD superfamily hydrolase
MNLILQAAKWAHEAHQDQVRKYNGRLFIEHPMRVAGWTSLMRDQQPEYVAAAWLHDVKEDQWKYWLKIEALIPGSVRIIVDQLTNPSKKHPELNRARRKAMDRKHLTECADCTKVIKMIDRYDNLCDVAEAEDDFKRVYAQESLLLVQAIRPVLFDTDLTPWCNAVEQQANKLLA